MKSENFWGLSSLLKDEKDILWIGGEDEVPPELPRDLIQRTKYLSFAQFSKKNESAQEELVVVSLKGQLPKPDLLRVCLGKISRPPILIFNLGSEPEDQNELLPALSGFEFANFINWPTDKEHLEAAIRKVTDGQTQDASSMRGLVRFIHNVSAVTDIGSLLRVLREELQPFNYVKSPIVGVADTAEQWRVFFFQGNEIIERTTQNVWPQSTKTRVNDVKDSQYLANILERPFVKLLTIPLMIRREVSGESLRVPAVLFLEHALQKQELAEFLDFVDARMQPFVIALDRVLLEADLKKASVLWEKTFDNFKDPIAIYDSDGQLVRGNKAYSLALGDLKKSDFMLQLFKHDDRYYEPKSYPIHFVYGRQSSNTIIHFLDVTRAHKLRRQMVQNEKMAALGHLAGNIAHELNNPLTGIRSLAQVLLHKAKPETPLFSDLTEVEKATERCQIIIQNLLDFSSGGVGEKQSVVRFQDIVEKTLPLLKANMRMLNVDTRFLNKGDEVYVEPHLMQQVVFNILKNACQAMPEGGDLFLKIFRKTQSIGNEQPVDTVVLSIRDTGKGIAPENLDKIFEYFFTTKSQGQGTGLGLAMSKGIVNRFGGQITLQSEVGKGTEFCVWLPYAGTDHR